MCYRNADKIFVDNFNAFERLAGASQQEIDDVAWALMTVCLAWGINNMRVLGIGDFTPGLARVVDAMTAIDSDFTVWGFTRKADLCSKILPVRDNLVIWASTDSSMPDVRVQQAMDFAKLHGTGLSYATEYGIAYKSREPTNPLHTPWWKPPYANRQPMAGIDPFLENLMTMSKIKRPSVIFGYHGRGLTTHVDVSLTDDFHLVPTFGYPECPGTDPLGGAHFLGACQECYWCIEKPALRDYGDLAEARMNKIVTIPHGKHCGTPVLIDTGERV
jgi:hypothetical protein